MTSLRSTTVSYLLFQQENVIVSNCCWLLDPNYSSLLCFVCILCFVCCDRVSTGCSWPSFPGRSAPRFKWRQHGKCQGVRQHFYAKKTLNFHSRLLRKILRFTPKGENGVTLSYSTRNSRNLFKISFWHTFNTFSSNIDHPNEKVNFLCRVIYFLLSYRVGEKV